MSGGACKPHGGGGGGGGGGATLIPCSQACPAYLVKI